MQRLTKTTLALLNVVACAVLSGCSSSTGAAGTSPETVSMWFHSGQPAEATAIEGQIAQYNREHSGTVVVTATAITEADYNDRVQLAALTGDLPDVLNVDGPLTSNYAYQKLLAPLGDLLPEDRIRDLTDLARRQGTYHETLYTAGAIDSGLVLYADKRALARAGISVPGSAQEAWTAQKFSTVLARLAQFDVDGRVLDLSLSYGVGEWYTYGFAPVIWSAGGDLSRSSAFRTAQQALNRPKVVDALLTLQRWTKLHVDRNTDGKAFTDGRVPLSWGGHWMYPGFHTALGSNLVVLPLPNFGFGTKTDSGSWTWGVAATSEHKKASADFIAFLLSTEQVQVASTSSMAPPATRSAMRASPLYSKNAPLGLMGTQLAVACLSVVDRSCIAGSRPTTPAYPVITAAFQEVIEAVFNDGNVVEALATAARLIDDDFLANAGYKG